MKEGVIHHPNQCKITALHNNTKEIKKPSTIKEDPKSIKLPEVPIKEKSLNKLETKRIIQPINEEGFEFLSSQVKVYIGVSLGFDGTETSSDETIRR